MNTLHAPGRISSLNPFGIGGDPDDPTAPTRQVRASVVRNESLEEVEEELGCVDWYLYPSDRVPKRASTPGAS